MCKIKKFVLNYNNYKSTYNENLLREDKVSPFTFDAIAFCIVILSFIEPKHSLFKNFNNKYCFTNIN